MDAKLKTFIFWGLSAVCLGGFWVNHQMDEAQAAAEEAALKNYRKNTVNPLLRKVNELTEPRSHDQFASFKATDFLARMGDYEKRTDAQRCEIKEAYAYLLDKQGTEQPENICKQWVNQMQRLQAAQKALSALQNEAQIVYDDQMKLWLAAAAETDVQTSHTKELEDLLAELESLASAVQKRRRTVDGNSLAYTGYFSDGRRIARRIKLVQQVKEEWEQQTRAAVEARAAIVTESGEINHNSEPIQRAEKLLASILVTPPCDADALAAPAVLPAPPPPPFRPDIRIVATGDLADSLLEPLVNQWLKARNATPMEGRTFTWNTPDENTREIEVKAPESLQGADKGVLRIRLTTEPNGAAVFTHILPGGDADLVLTGRKMNKQTETQWLPQGKTLEMLDTKGKGRAFRTRVCSDALIFFRGAEMELETVTANVLLNTPKVYAIDDSGRLEAAALFGQKAGVGDKRVMAADKAPAAISLENPHHIFMGTWHKDGLNHSPGMALFAAGKSALGYSTCWDDEEVLKIIPKEYRSVGAGCLPTDDTINSGQYAFAYNVTFYRTTQPEPKAAAAADLMAYASDVNNKEVEELVRVRGFAPLQFELNKPDNTLTDKDMPLGLVIREMEQADLDMGYEADTSTWVYGVRIPIPLYYEVGSATSDGRKTVEIDPDSRYYTESQGIQAINKLVQDKRACLVLVGHADPQWGKVMDTGKESWKNNLKLSEERAKGVYQSLFRDIFDGNAKLGNVQLGTSWARPAADLDSKKSVEEQETALSRCRRVDIFLVFPMVAE